ncbi:MAG: 2,3-bisphosphoglycerate-independent phosphoglycerate mutase [Phycisphaerae bacterium]|nr:2,3-bisphosphoglycerate-independent phosphoglycerate mutase [Phycisphaerae bacterium]
MPKLDKRPVVLVIRDGWGANPDPKWHKANAIELGKTPNTDRLMAEYPHTLIHTSGEHVGLPAGTMGNSEVGHQNIGAGRIVDQEVMRITRAIRDGSFFENPAMCAAADRAKDTGGCVHVMGLLSDIGVHSVLPHLYAVVELCKRRGVPGEHVIVHAFGDGRDSPPDSGIEYIRQVEAKLAEIGAGRVGTVVGRFYAMDRDNRWQRVEKAYRLLTRGEGHRVASAEEAFRRYYDNPTGPSQIGDEFIEPTVVCPDGTEPAIFRDGDSVVFFNFRGDRPREITKAFVLDEFPFRTVDKDGTEKQMGFDRGKKLDLFFCTLTAYETSLPVRVAFEKPPKMKGLLGEYMAELGLKQFRCAETEKFPHVTFFFNDYRDEPFPNEDRQLVASPREVTTYDEKPEMSAYEVTDAVVARIESGKYDLIAMNYANGDMVGHTGSLDAAIRAVEAVDECVGRVVDAVRKAGGALVITADHGNCELMVDPKSGGAHTAHTTYDVELIVVDDRFKGKPLRADGTLADIAPTVLHLMGLEPPAEMTGKSLLQA